MKMIMTKVLRFNEERLDSDELLAGVKDEDFFVSFSAGDEPTVVESRDHRHDALKKSDLEPIQ